MGLTLDLRYEHVDKVRTFWEAWVPIVYSGVMVVLGALCLRHWGRGGRQVLGVAFAVGVVGFWLHNHGHLVSAVMQVLSAWTQPIRHKDVPPQLAPLAFVGLGLLGMLACASRLQLIYASEKDEEARAQKPFFHSPACIGDNYGGLQFCNAREVAMLPQVLLRSVHQKENLQGKKTL